MANSKIGNSLSYFLEQALILEKNSLETVSKVSDAVTEFISSDVKTAMNKYNFIRS